VLKEIKPVERSGSKTAATAMALERERIEAACPSRCASSRSTNAART
jgi:23S rRNA (pseudouridine1915-N3)-methyltransferase